MTALQRAGCTVAYRRSGLAPWQAAAFVNSGSALALLPWPVADGGSRLQATPPGDLLFQALWQGVLAGLWAFSAAIARLGAAFGALVPAIAAVGDGCWLGDRLDAIEVVAVLATSAGVVLARGARVMGRPGAAD